MTEETFYPKDFMREGMFFQRSIAVRPSGDFDTEPERDPQIQEAIEADIREFLGAYARRCIFDTMVCIEDLRRMEGEPENAMVQYSVIIAPESEGERILRMKKEMMQESIKMKKLSGFFVQTYSSDQC
jgi:hypothetical protein